MRLRETATFVLAPFVRLTISNVAGGVKQCAGALSAREPVRHREL